MFKKKEKKQKSFLGKVVKKTAIGTGVLFAIYITNADSKLVEVIYDGLYKYHRTKPVEDKI